MVAWGQTNWIEQADTKWYDDNSGATKFIISTAEELAGLAKLVNEGTDDFSDKTIKLGNDIQLNNTSGWESWETTPPKNSWTPIGTQQNQFKGTFNGQGNTVSGIYINNTSDRFQGLFGNVNVGRIQNLTVAESYICGGKDSAGGIVGYTWGGTVSNCSNSGTVSGETVGGIVGESYGWVLNCSNSGTVSGKTVGGIVGKSGGTVSNCLNSGMVISPKGSDADNTGGIVGYNSGTVSNCLNSGMVISPKGSDADNTGGIVGYNSGTVSNCSNSGTVTGDAYYVGGIVGDNFYGDTVSDCYYLESTCEKGIGVGQEGENVEVKSEAEYKSGEVAYLLQGGKEEQFWGQVIDTNDYPVLIGNLSEEDQAAYKVYSATFTYTLPDAQEATTVIKYGNNGTPLTAPEVEVPDGYTFAWDKEPDKFGTEDLTFNGIFTEEPAIAYTLTINQPENGTISATADGKSINSGDNVAEGATVILTATTNSGYHFVEWNVVPGNISIEDNQFTMPAEDVTIQAVTHMLIKIEAVAATCTEDGNIEYWTCESCGKYFNKDATEEITKEETIIKAGHKPITIGEKEPTCTEDGYTGDKVCVVCGDVVEYGTVIPANGQHNYVDGICTICGAKDPDYVAPEPEPEPEPAYFTLDFDEHPCDGVTLNSNLTAVEEGGTLYLYVEKEDETLYDYDNMRIYAKRGANADWEELTEDPNRPGVYPIADIWTDIFIKVEGVTPKDPTAIERVETLRIYATAGLLHVETPTRQRVTIVSMAGALIADGEQEGARIYRDLNAGIYIVRVGDYATKVRVE